MASKKIYVRARKNIIEEDIISKIFVADKEPVSIDINNKLDGEDVYATISSTFDINHRGMVFESFKNNYDFVSIVNDFYDPLKSMIDSKLVTTSLQFTTRNNSVTANVNPHTVVFMSQSSMININIKDIEDMIYSKFNEIIVIKLKCKTYIIIYK